LQRHTLCVHLRTPRVAVQRIRVATTPARFASNALVARGCSRDVDPQITNCLNKLHGSDA
jgi:hypothetical protein